MQPFSGSYPAVKVKHIGLKTKNISPKRNFHPVTGSFILFRLDISENCSNIAPVFDKKIETSVP